ncbi:CLUMA_CG012142, isoform A [Clunio marinus]|uniref:CLUMA_CG012142, isoform A n=1 Tax=Clunio marinus TaxID=568069 RepID=A0A1J1IFR6_9DIPT|nr:CLUMA_CG012142, isoform A [Clunio marinus]
MGCKVDRLTSCCGCGSLKAGTIIAGMLGILLSIATIVIILTTKIDFKTVIFDDWISKSAIKIILIVNLCMTIILSALLIVGAIIRNQYLFLPWIILGIMLCIGLLVDVIYTAVVFFIDDHTTAGILWLVIGLICVVIYFYLWYVVLSHFLQLKEQNDRGRYSRTPYRR